MRLRVLGIAWVSCAAAAVLTDALLRSDPTPPPPAHSPPGFFHKLGGLGSVETAFAGAVTLTSEDRIARPDGSVLLVPALRVEGRDPVPRDHGAALRDVVVTRLPAPGESASERPPAVPAPPPEAPLYTLRAPSGFIPLDEGAPTLAVDRDQAWTFASPEMEMPLGPPPDVGADLGVGPPTPGGPTGPPLQLHLRASNGVLQPRSGRVRCSGPFDLSAGAVELSSHDLWIEPERSRLAFGGPGTPVTWSFTDRSGQEYFGWSDGGGSLVMEEEGRARLELPAHQRCEMELPPGLGASGLVQCRGVRVLMRAAAQGWQPERAELLGPVFWQGNLLLPAGFAAAGATAGAGPPLANPLGFPQGSGDWLPGGEPAATGSSAGAWWLWDESGALLGVQLHGPLEILHLAPPAAWLRAAGGAYYDLQEPVSLYLYRDLTVWDVQGWHQADWLLWRPEQAEGGGVALRNGELRAQRMSLDASGRRTLDGHTLIRDPGGAFTLSAPRVEVDDEGRGLARDGFLLETGGSDPLRASGERAELDEVAGKRRLRARQEVSLRRAGVEFHGDSLLHLEDTRTIVEGNPARAELASELGPLTARARRFLFEEQRLLADGDPRLLVPAAALGLSGAAVEVEARFLRFHPAEERWELGGGVLFHGGLEGQSRSASWSAAQGLRLLGSGAPATLSGAALDGTRFELSAQELHWSSGGAVFLSGGADALLTDPASGAKLRLQGASGMVSQEEGWFEENARLESDQVSARAERIDWGPSGAPQERLIRLLRHARVEQGALVATGTEVRYWSGPERELLEVLGDAAQPARIEFGNGRAASGQSLRFDRRTFLLSGDQGRIELPPE